jgi:hypothetical protein
MLLLCYVAMIQCLLDQTATVLHYSYMYLASRRTTEQLLTLVLPYAACGCLLLSSRTGCTSHIQ